METMNEFSEIVNSHPEIILTSRNPATWEGFLLIDPNLGFNLDIKLIVPNYPDLRDATVLFGKSISLLYGTGLDAKVASLLENTSSVSMMLLQLKRVMMNLIKAKFGDCPIDSFNSRRGIIDELKAALQTQSPVTISASSGLNSVKLSLDKVALTMRKDLLTNSWKILSSDLPELLCSKLLESHIGSLAEATSELQNTAEMLRDAWELLDEIDHSCWVLDPARPKPYHLYRRIKLTSSLSALITIDPTRVTDLPDIKLLGGDSDVAKYRNIMSSNLLKWDPESSIGDNLRILLAIDNLPQPPEEEELLDREAIVDDKECCICFAMELDDSSPPQLPVEICDNEKCRRHFHTRCLLQWLQSIAANQVSFERIHGSCPNCNESISCTVR